MKKLRFNYTSTRDIPMLYIPIKLTNNLYILEMDALVDTGSMLIISYLTK